MSPLREERISSSSHEAPPSDHSLSVIHGKGSIIEDVSSVMDEPSRTTALTDISNTGLRSRSAGRRMRVYPGQPKDGPSAARRLEPTAPPREPRSRSVCGYTGRGRQDKENDMNELGSIYTNRMTTSFRSRNEADIIAAAPFEPCGGRLRRGLRHTRDEERHIRMLEAELGRYRQMVDLLRERERVREEMLDNEAQTEDCVISSDDYAASSPVNGGKLPLPPLCVQVRDLEKALIEKTKKWSVEKLELEAEIHNLRQEKYLNDMRYEELQRENIHEVNKIQQEMRYAQVENIQLKMQVQEASRMGDEEFKRVKAEVIQLRAELEEVSSELKLARMVTAIEEPSSSTSSSKKSGRLALSLL